MDNQNIDQNIVKEPVDLATLDLGPKSEHGAELELVNFITGEPLGIYLTIAGSDSRAWRKAMTDMRAGRQKNGEPDMEGSRREDIEIMAKCTFGWRNLKLDGRELEFSRENALMLYDRFNWIREQAVRFANNRANFLPA